MTKYYYCNVSYKDENPKFHPIGMAETDGDDIFIYGDTFGRVCQRILKKDDFGDEYDIPSHASEVINLLKQRAANEYTKIVDDNKVINKKNFSKENFIVYNAKNATFNTIQKRK